MITLQLILLFWFSIRGNRIILIGYLQVLQERGESTSRHGRATFSVLLFQVHTQKLKLVSEVPFSSHFLLLRCLGFCAYVLLIVAYVKSPFLLFTGSGRGGFAYPNTPYFTKFI